MRTITKTITLAVDGQKRTFRLTKLDAFSGAGLLKLLSRHIPGLVGSGTSEDGKNSASENETLIFSIFTSLSDADLRALMISCLGHVEVLLEAGWQPVMMQGEWGWEELAHDAATALKLTRETALWTLQGFFGESGSTSQPAEASV